MTHEKTPANYEEMSVLERINYEEMSVKYEL